MLLLTVFVESLRVEGEGLLVVDYKTPEEGIAEGKEKVGNVLLLGGVAHHRLHQRPLLVRFAHGGNVAAVQQIARKDRSTVLPQQMGNIGRQTVERGHPVEGVVGEDGVHLAGQQLLQLLRPALCPVGGNVLREEVAASGHLVALAVDVHRVVLLGVAHHGLVHV